MEKVHIFRNGGYECSTSTHVAMCQTLYTKKLLSPFDIIRCFDFFLLKFFNFNKIYRKT